MSSGTLRSCANLADAESVAEEAAGGQIGVQRVCQLQALPLRVRRNLSTGTLSWSMSVQR